MKYVLSILNDSLFVFVVSITKSFLLSKLSPQISNLLPKVL